MMARCNQRFEDCCRWRSAVILRAFPGALVEVLLQRRNSSRPYQTAHSHLELTVMRGFLEREEHDFFAWLRKLTVARLQMTDERLVRFRRRAGPSKQRAREYLPCDSSSFAVQSMRALSEVGLRAIVYQESFVRTQTCEKM